MGAGQSDDRMSQTLGRNRGYFYKPGSWGIGLCSLVWISLRKMEPPSKSAQFSPTRLSKKDWKQTQYRNFKDNFRAYNDQIDDVSERSHPHASIQKWRSLFGDRFG